MADLWRDFWIRETGTGQQVAQLHDRYMTMMMMKYVHTAGLHKLINTSNNLRIAVSCRETDYSLPYPQRHPSSGPHYWISIQSLLLRHCLWIAFFRFSDKNPVCNFSCLSCVFYFLPPDCQFKFRFTPCLIITLIFVNIFLAWIGRPSGLMRPLWGFEITLRHTTLGMTLWTSDQPDAETSTWQQL